MSPAFNGTVKWTPRALGARSLDIRPFGQMRGRAPEETAGDNPDDALRLMDGSQIASYREAVFEGPSSDRREASASYLLGVPQARCRKKKENLRLASSDRWHPSLVFTSVAASVRSCWLPREGRGKQRPPRSEPPPHTPPTPPAQ